MQQEFTTFDVMRILKIDRERLREWTKKGYIRPSIQEATGTGTKSLFSKADLYRIGLFRKLIAAGIQRDGAAHLVNSISDVYLQEFSGVGIPAKKHHYYILFRKLRLEEKGKDNWETQGHTLGRFDDNELVLHLGEIETLNYDFSLIINFAKIIKEVNASI